MFKTQGYESHRVAEANLLFSESLESINKIRTQLGKFLNISELQRASSWADRSHSGLILQKPQSELIFDSVKKSISHIDIFNPPITIRRAVTLNEKQKKRQSIVAHLL